MTATSEKTDISFLPHESTRRNHIILRVLLTGAFLTLCVDRAALPADEDPSQGESVPSS